MRVTRSASSTRWSPQPTRRRSKRVNDGLPETLEEVVAAYGHRYFKLKVGGDMKLEPTRRLSHTSRQRSSTTTPATYNAHLDGNEQYEQAGAVMELWRSIGENSPPRAPEIINGAAGATDRTIARAQ